MLGAQSSPPRPARRRGRGGSCRTPVAMASKKIGLRPAEIKLGSTIDYKEWLADNGPEQGGPRATCPAPHPSQAGVTPSAQYIHSSLVSV